MDLSTKKVAGMLSVLRKVQGEEAVGAVLSDKSKGSGASASTKKLAAMLKYAGQGSKN